MAKERHHHGSLRETLIAESRRLISIHGVEGFKIAAACRAAGVTTAAPYKHFENREELLDAISGIGFQELTERMEAALAEHPGGSIEGLIAMGQAYIRFADADPEMFYLMWGATRESVKSETTKQKGHACFHCLLDVLDAITSDMGYEEGELDLRQVALPLWSSIHGLACLKLGKRLNVCEGIDLDETIDKATRAFIGTLRR